MNSYTIILLPTEGGYTAYCPVLPECRATERGRQAAYKAMKTAIRRHVQERLARGEVVPLDRTTTKFYRLDVRRLREEDVLR